MRLPDLQSSQADVLDTLRADPDRGWSYREICEDTGRTLRCVQGVSRTLRGMGLVTVDLVEIGPRPTASVQITEEGLRWLWFVERGIPPRHYQILFALLETLEGIGKVQTTTITGQVNYQLRAIRALELAGCVEIERTTAVLRQVQITDYGRYLLRSYRGLNAERLRRGDPTGLG